MVRLASDPEAIQPAHRQNVIVNDVSAYTDRGGLGRRGGPRAHGAQPRLGQRPAASWWDSSTDTINPVDDDETDALAWHLWAAARDRVPLPVLDEIHAEQE